jgi:transcriptional regulator with XRE-family HTH domain
MARTKNRFPRKAEPPRIESPVGMESAEDMDVDELEPIADASFVWSPSAGFPAYLRRVREASGVSMRQAAPALGVSYAWLARLETGGYARPPSLQRLHAMAELYRVDAREMLHEAGVRIALPPDLGTGASLDERFKALVLHPELRPALLDESALAYIPDRVKRQWLEFASKLANHPDPTSLIEASNKP